MCLDLITKVLVPNEDVITAWKVFDIRSCDYADPVLRFLFYKWEGLKNVCLDEWLKAEKESIGNLYMSGFHVFETEVDAITYAEIKNNHCDLLGVIPVKVRGVQIMGEQDGFKVLVCDEMYVDKKLAVEALA